MSAIATGYKREGYSDKPVEARLGPHRFLFPMNLYYDQMGPDFQGGVGLSVQWPDLEPLPPGQNFHDDKQTRYKAIGISLDHPDRVPIETYLERGTQPYGDPEDPLQNLQLRIKGESLYGLTPYYADLDKVKSYWIKEGHTASALERDNLISWGKDWYLAYGSQSALATFISCDSREITEKIEIQGDQLIIGDPHIPGCMHEIVIPENHLAIQIRYRRVFLKEWKRIEDRVRQLIEQARID